MPKTRKRRTSVIDDDFEMDDAQEMEDIAVIRQRQAAEKTERDAAFAALQEQQKKNGPFYLGAPIKFDKNTTVTDPQRRAQLEWVGKNLPNVLNKMVDSAEFSDTLKSLGKNKLALTMLFGPLGLVVGLAAGPLSKLLGSETGRELVTKAVNTLFNKFVNAATTKTTQPKMTIPNKSMDAFIAEAKTTNEKLIGMNLRDNYTEKGGIVIKVGEQSHTPGQLIAVMEQERDDIVLLDQNGNKYDPRDPLESHPTYIATTNPQASKDLMQILEHPPKTITVDTQDGQEFSSTQINAANAVNSRNPGSISFYDNYGEKIDASEDPAIMVFKDERSYQDYCQLQQSMTHDAQQQASGTPSPTTSHD